MAKNENEAKPTFGPQEGEAAADAYPADVGVSRDAKDYVLVTKYAQDADGLRIEEQVLKSDLEGETSATIDPESDEYKGLSLDSDNVREAHPAANRPTSDLREDEAKELGREIGRG